MKAQTKTSAKKSKSKLRAEIAEAIKAIKKGIYTF